MTNASVKKLFAGLSIFALCLVLNSGALVSIAHAQDDMGYADTSGDNMGYADTSGDNMGYSDSGDMGYADTSGDNLGYADTSGDNMGYADTSGDNMGYGDTSGDNLGYADTSGDNLGYADTYNSPTPDYSEVDYSETPTYTTGGSYGVTNPVYTTGGIGYSSSVYTTPSIGYSAPIIAPTPVIHTVTPTPIVYNTPTQTSQPIVINNTNTNTNTNVNTAPVAPATPQTIVVYSQPVVPTYVPPVRTYVPPTAPSPYVSLTQIPYTGFDFGPIGDTIYWIGLALFASAAAYLLVYYRGGAFALAGEMIKNRRSQTNTTTNHTVAHVEPVKAEVHTEAPVANTYVAPVAPIARALPGTDMRRTTADAMIVAHSKNGEIPRIVITRA